MCSACGVDGGHLGIALGGFQAMFGDERVVVAVNQVVPMCLGAQDALLASFSMGCGLQLLGVGLVVKGQESP